MLVQDVKRKACELPVSYTRESIAAEMRKQEVRQRAKPNEIGEPARKFGL